MDRAVLERLRENHCAVIDRIAAAAGRAGRDPRDITLVAVTKSVSTAIAGGLLDVGIGHLGENRVQEGVRKHAELGPRCRWHMIGHLQTNKVKKTLEIFQTIHAVDSEHLLREISRRTTLDGAATVDCAAPEILLEVNISGEESKYGLEPGAVRSMVALARELPGVELCGLMTMAPYDPDPEAARPYFREMAALYRALHDEGLVGQRFRMLSMGMSGDFEVAVEEGATHVRVGTALFKGL